MAASAESTSARSTSSPARESSKPHPYPLWSPRFWHGMRFGDWLRLLWENGFRVHPIRWAMAVLISLTTLFISVMALMQRWRYGRQVAATPVAPPIFIIGHWRSGTTYLHELMVLDDRLAFPTTYQCFAPEHFLISEWLFARWCGFLLPKQRPMDNVSAGWQRPQEDEFALLTMGVRTPYRRMAFPNNPPPDMAYLNMEGLTETELDTWSAAMKSFVQAISFRSPRRVVLKSPTHTGRVAQLARIFPGAQFIHISRDPLALFPSTCRLWKSLDAVQGCQIPHNRYLQEYVYDCLLRMYDGFEKQRAELEPGQIIDVRYEDLVADPVRVLQSIYERLQLGEFEPMRERLTQYVGEQRDYQTNRHNVSPEQQAEIQRRWSAYFTRYGYPMTSTSSGEVGHQNLS